MSSSIIVLVREWNRACPADFSAHTVAVQRDEWVLVTGASAGIGCALATVFAANGFNLVLVARNQSRLSILAQELANRHQVKTKVLSKDLSMPEAAPQIFDELQRDLVEVSILVNNAGFGLRGAFADGPVGSFAEMVQVNIGALVELTGLFVPPMLKRGRGRILNLASTAAFEPGPLMAVYYASKAFVFSFSYALAEELSSSGITVTALCPGPTKTEFQNRAGTNQSPRWADRWMMDAETVAKMGFDGLMAGKRVVIPGAINKLGFVLAKCAPTGLAAKVARRVIEG